MASNNYLGEGERDGVKQVLIVPNVQSHLPPRFTQFSWLFGLHGGLLAHQSAVTGKTIQSKYCDEARIMTRQLQRVESPTNPLSVSNITEALEQKQQVRHNLNL